MISELSMYIHRVYLTWAKNLIFEPCLTHTKRASHRTLHVFVRMYPYISQSDLSVRKEGEEVLAEVVPLAEGGWHHQRENQDHQGQIKVCIHTVDLPWKTDNFVLVVEGAGDSG